MLPDRGCSQAAHTPPPPPGGQGFPPSSGRFTEAGLPCLWGWWASETTHLNSVPSQLSLARLPSLPHPQIPVREPWDPALRVSGLPASCPRLWAKPKALPKASEWTPVFSQRRAQRPGQSTGLPSPGLPSRSQPEPAGAGNPGSCLHRKGRTCGEQAHPHPPRKGPPGASCSRPLGHPAFTGPRRHQPPPPSEF